MSDSYVARYTPCGHSIKQLRDDANRRKKAEGITHGQALHQVARELKYSNWDELINQKSDAKRDDFFQGMFQDRKDSEMTRNLYAEFLRQKGLADSKDVYRLFVLQQWKSYEALGMKNLDLTDPPMASDIMMEELALQVQRKGAHGLLPQNMGARLLESTVWAGRIFKSDKTGLPDEIIQGYLTAGLFCVTGIRSFQLRSDKVTLDGDELFDLIGQYYMLAELEFVSRRTGLRFTLPNVDQVFMPDAKLSFQFPEAVREMMTAGN